jgi:hypothetical protein
LPGRDVDNNAVLLTVGASLAMVMQRGLQVATRAWKRDELR